MRTSVWAAKFAVLVFLLPFAFVLRPGLLMQGDTMTILADVTIVTGALIFMAPAFVGFYSRVLPGWLRIILIACGVAAMLGATLPWLAWGAVCVGMVLLLASSRIGAAGDQGKQALNLPSVNADERG
jgi:TRAP-type uncharacterized transport system fused permease subunit